MAFRRNAFLQFGFDREDYSNPRDDIAKGIVKRMLVVPPDPRMVCWTRLPTRVACMARDNFLPSILGVTVPFAAVGTVGLINELIKIWEGLNT